MKRIYTDVLVARHTVRSQPELQIEFHLCTPKIHGVSELISIEESQQGGDKE